MLYRTHTLSELRTEHIGQSVILSGWVASRRDHGGLIFIDLRDRHGITQIVSDPAKNAEIHKIADGVRSEYVLRAEGVVRARPDKMANPKLSTGEIEVLIYSLSILSPAKTTPFEIEHPEEQEKDVSEELRLKYRYLDLRRRRMQTNIIFRGEVIHGIRDYLHDHGFTEVETPMLIKGTPEGSREYIVPSRLYPGNFYVLPQSPQQLKQLLMVSGLDRYFQIARCFRDEDQRGDRQPEFTQLDMELSFVDEQEVMDLNEALMIALVETLLPHKKIKQKPFPRMTWKDAMDRFGSDKPDIRFEMEMCDVTDIVKECRFEVFRKAVADGGVVKALRVTGGGSFSRKVIDEYTEIAKTYGAKGLAYFSLEKGEPKGAILKFFEKGEIIKLIYKTGARDGDIVFFSADRWQTACLSLGNVRLACADTMNLKDKDLFSFAWIHEFPLFEYSKEEGTLVSAHHPFTHPHPDDLPFLMQNPEKVRALAYDLALNGCEVAGGSIRIHDSVLQSKIFEVLKIASEDADRRFGHLLRAFEYGAPPHGGIAWGLDRVIMLFRDEKNIREVIAFPKDQKAKDLMLGAPSELPEAQVKEMHVHVIARRSL
ncbi:aspartate--tRNA ligase [Candidatus Peregrinibacteria bacterium]|nr:aspartate--tRNA ligase [Candidatus Peregrinibacteria bacterium]